MSYKVDGTQFGIEQTSYWPYAENGAGLPQPELTDGPWVLSMTAGGLVFLSTKHEIQNSFYNRIGGIPFYHGEDPEELRRFFITFCSRGYYKDERLLHQDGTQWLFNWVSGTIAQIQTAKLVAQAFFRSKSQEDYNAAWQVGRTFEDQLIKAVDAEYAKQHSV